MKNILIPQKNLICNNFFCYKFLNTHLGHIIIPHAHNMNFQIEMKKKITKKTRDEKKLRAGATPQLCFPMLTIN